MTLGFFLLADDSTGLYSVYAEHQSNEIMFHVSTLLPFTPNNTQQVIQFLVQNLLIDGRGGGT